MNCKIVEEGKFKVYESGLIEKLSKGVYVPAHMTETRVGRNQVQYEMVVSYCEHGEQTQYYAKRLLADAFVPSLNNSGFIDYLDGDHTNLNANNLFRKTQVERSKKVLETRRENSEPCKWCGEKTMSFKHICKDCQVKEKEVKRLIKIEATKNRRISKAKKYFGEIDLDSLKPIEISYVNRKLQGYTLEEIGEEFGKTKEWIRQVLVKVKERKQMEWEILVADEKEALNSALAYYINISLKDDGYKVTKLDTHYSTKNLQWEALITFE